MLAVTERASTELKAMLASMPEPRPLVRVFIDHRCHCGNVRFGMALAREAPDGDTEISVGGVPFVADAETVPELPLAEIGYQEGLMRRGFTIRNVNHECGSH